MHHSCDTCAIWLLCLHVWRVIWHMWVMSHKYHSCHTCKHGGDWLQPEAWDFCCSVLQCVEVISSGQHHNWCDWMQKWDIFALLGVEGYCSVLQWQVLDCVTIGVSGCCQIRGFYMCCRVLQWVALSGLWLYHNRCDWMHPATHCNTLQCTATHCNTLQHREWDVQHTLATSYITQCATQSYVMWIPH